jgi:uncharacterized protein (TIGR04255 family)
VSVFNLDDVPSYHLDRAPLVQAIMQIQFPLVAHLQTYEGIAPIQDALGDVFPFMQRQDVQALSISVGPTGVSHEAPAPTLVWELSDEAGFRLAIAPGVATLSVGSAYEGIEDFVRRFDRVLHVLGEVEGLRRCDRIGVRYVSVATPPPGDEELWLRWFRPEFIGWVGSDILAEETQLVSAVTQVSVVAPASGPLEEAAGDVQGLLRHGFVPAGSTIPGLAIEPLTHDGYVLDLDVFVATPQTFDPSRTMRQALALHSQLDRLFRWTLTPEGASYFGLREGTAA